MERVGKRRRGPPPLHDMAVHMDGAINQVIMTSVYVLYVDKCSGEVTQGGSREHGGGLNYGSSADGQMRRGAEGLAAQVLTGTWGASNRLPSLSLSSSGTITQ